MCAGNCIKAAILIAIAVLLTGEHARQTDAEYAYNMALAQQVTALIPNSQEMVNAAILLLEKRWQGMSLAERELFSQLFDPGNTGQIDDAYVQEVLHNYRFIQKRLKEPIHVRAFMNDGRCVGHRLYYTDMRFINVCPYFAAESNMERKARDLIHEVAHMTMFVNDRPYYYPNTISQRFRELTPRSPFESSLPILDYLVCELLCQDTLHHPDCYAWFAFECYLNQQRQLEP
jgi:hypothetical protein